MTEPQAARAWREALRLTRAELSALTGYSSEAIAGFERNQQTNGSPAGERAWRRYRGACLLASILLTLDRPEFSVENWRWGNGPLS
jgi:transcriptional regulator with XRE-family HTH domain